FALSFRVREIAQSEERRFWGCLTIAFGFLLVLECFYYFFPAVRKTPTGAVAIDCLYLMFYLSLVLASEIKPHLKPGWASADPAHRFDASGAALFVFGLLVYFVLIPSSVNRNVYETFVPSMYLYLALDLFLVVRFVYLRRASKNQRWRTLYGWLAVTAALLGGTDLLDCLHYAKILDFRSGTLLDMFWFMPFLAMVATARLRHYPFPGQQRYAEETPLRRPLWRGSALILYVLIFPIFHFAFYFLGVLDSASRPARGITVLSLMVVLGTMAFAQALVLERNNRALQSDRLRLAAIVESSDDAIIGTTMEGKILSWNSAAARIYGYSAQEVLGSPFSILIPPDDSGETPHILQQVRSGKRVDHHETVCLRRDKQRIDVSLTISPIKDSTGQITGLSAIARDITEQKRALIQEERRHVAQKMLVVLMHETYNPLTAILGNLSLLKSEGDMPVSARESLKDIEESAHRIQSVQLELKKLDLADPRPVTGI
ncbi:MAG TPA: PAS domain S-box protein, partial [Acidobacteriota bacterium]